MIKKFLFTLLILNFSLSVFPQSVTFVNSRFQADIVVYIAEYRHEADLFIYKTNLRHEVRSGVWYEETTSIRHQSHVLKVYITRYKHEADFIIIYTNSRGGVRTNSKYDNMVRRFLK
jgi:hypothetical protein